MPGNIVLIGFSGTGKSSVGQGLATRLGWGFVDLDDALVLRFGRPLSQVFAEEGEAKFRALERDFIERGHPDHGCIVACGGGLVVPAGMLELLRNRGVVICLHAPLETILQRTMHATHRPLFEVENREQRVRELFAQREEIYRRTGTMVLTDRRPMREIAAHVLRVYRHEAAHFKK